MNPENDAIDQLVNDSLAACHQDSYDKPYSERCEHCSGSWHGQPRSWQQSVPGMWTQDSIKPGCPGAYATEEQVAKWHELKKVKAA